MTLSLCICCRSVWNVPYITSCYLINGTVLKESELRPNYAYEKQDHDMAFCADMRKKVTQFYYFILEMTFS